MADFNSVTVVGRLTADPELKYTPSGSAVVNFAVATSRKYTKKDTNEKVEETTFLDCEAWGRTAEVVAEYLKKGREVLVAGSLKQSRWEDKDTGQKRSKIRVLAQNVQFLGSPKGKGDNAGQGGQDEPFGG